MREGNKVIAFALKSDFVCWKNISFVRCELSFSDWYWDWRENYSVYIKL